MRLRIRHGASLLSSKLCKLQVFLIPHVFSPNAFRADSFESLVNEKNDVIDDLSKQIWEKDGQIDKLQKEVEGLQADRVEPGEPHLRAEQFCMDETAPLLQVCLVIRFSFAFTIRCMLRSLSRLSSTDSNFFLDERIEIS